MPGARDLQLAQVSVIHFQETFLLSNFATCLCKVTASRNAVQCSFLLKASLSWGALPKTIIIIHTMMQLFAYPILGALPLPSDFRLPTFFAVYAAAGRFSFPPFSWYGCTCGQCSGSKAYYEVTLAAAWKVSLFRVRMCCCASFSWSEHIKPSWEEDEHSLWFDLLWVCHFDFS